LKILNWPFPLHVLWQSQLLECCVRFSPLLFKSIPCPQRRRAMQYSLQSLQNNWQEASPKIIKLTARRERGQSLLKWKNTINNSIPMSDKLLGRIQSFSEQWLNEKYKPVCQNFCVCYFVCPKFYTEDASFFKTCST